MTRTGLMSVAPLALASWGGWLSGSWRAEGPSPSRSSSLRRTFGFRHQAPAGASGCMFSSFLRTACDPA